MGRPDNKEKREKAAILLGQARLSRTEIAAQVGVDLSTIYRWEQSPEFKRQVAREIDEFRREQHRIGLATPEQRVAHKRHRHNLLMQVITARADHPSMADVPGGFTGTQVRRVKRLAVDSEDDRQPKYAEVVEYETDVGLLRALDTLERETAIELGQWMTKVEVSAVDMRAAVAGTQAVAEAYTDPDDADEGGDDERGDG